MEWNGMKRKGKDRKRKEKFVGKNGLNIPKNCKDQLLSISSNPRQVYFVNEDEYHRAKKRERYILYK